MSYKVVLVSNHDREDIDHVLHASNIPCPITAQHIADEYNKTASNSSKYYALVFESSKPLYVFEGY